MKTLFVLMLMTTACFPQSAVFDQQYAQAIQQNPPGIKLRIDTVDGRSSYRLSDVIKIRLVFTSERLNIYTIDKAPGGSAAVESTDFIVEGPGMTVPVHSLTKIAIACCGSDRHYLGHVPVEVATKQVSIKRIEWLMNKLPSAAFSSHLELKPGEDAIFAQTRNVMRGWPKSQHDSFHVPSDIVVTSSNVLHLTILPDGP